MNGAESNRDANNDFSMVLARSRSPLLDFATESPFLHKSSLPKLPESPAESDCHQLTAREVRVSFNKTVDSTTVRRKREYEVLSCNLNNLFQRKSSLLRSKTKSRLMDPPEENNLKFNSPSMSQFLGKGANESDDDDSLVDEDLPDEYKNMKLSAISFMQLLSLVLITVLMFGSLSFNLLKKKKICGLVLWKWELMVIVLISIRILSGWLIRIIVYFIERNCLLRKKVLYFVYGLRKDVQNCLWVFLVLIAWQCIFDHTDRKILPYVSRIWVCFLVGTFIWLLKTLLVKVLASSFHVNTFFDRIQESLFNQYVIETLSEAPIRNELEEENNFMIEAGAPIPAELKAKVLSQRSRRIVGSPRKSFSKTMSKKEEKNVIAINRLHRLNQKNISAWNMKRLMSIIKNGILFTLDEKLQGATGICETTVQITSENQAKVAAKRIFNNVAKPGSKFIRKDDLLRFMPEDEVLKTMSQLKGESDQQRISKGALNNWVVNAFRERRALALSLNDTKTAVKRLHQILNVLTGVTIVCIWLIILRVATVHFFFILLCSELLVLFLFRNACKATFQAIIFLFVMHPFDVGDRIEVDGVQMIVEEMNILTTVLLRHDNTKIYYPNSVLLTKPINNCCRSPDTKDYVEFSIHISTPREKIAMMKERITGYIEGRPDHWKAAPTVVMRDVDDMNRLKFSVWVCHTMNHQNMGERWSRRATLVEEMVEIFRKLNIDFRMIPTDGNSGQLPPPENHLNRLPSNWTGCD